MRSVTSTFTSHRYCQTDREMLLFPAISEVFMIAKGQLRENLHLVIRFYNYHIIIAYR